MLRFEKLSLQGFKSFCDPSEIIFDEEGITGVVGPNGCGKSNVADAISWVIGEQRAKALRGGKMEDVIFQGSRTRPPAGMAEVVLTLVVQKTFEIRGDSQPESEALKQAEESLLQAQVATNAIDEAVSTVAGTEEPEGRAAEGADGQAERGGEPTSSEASDSGASEPGALDQGGSDANGSVKPEQKGAGLRLARRKIQTKDAPRLYQAGDRITVARRLYRTGESEYEMNGRICRLRDVQDLFAGTGLGAAHYAIIEQGRIGQVLSAKPLDRRSLIEEAAGVSKFKMRQHAAELKLEASKQNLSRVTDIIAEIERQQNSLKRQAARARRYKRLRQETRDLMRAVYVSDYRGIRETLTILDAALAELSSAQYGFTASLSENESSLDDVTREARAAEEALNETREAVSNVELESDRARQQKTYLSEQIQSLNSRSAQFQRDQASIAERGQFIAQESARLREELQRIEQDINAESRTLADEENRHQEQARSDSDAERKLEEARKAVYDRVTHLERWRQLKRQFTDSVDRARARLDGLAAEADRARSQAQAAQDRLSGLAEEEEVTSIRQQETAELLAAVTAGLAELRRRREDRQNALLALQREITAAEQRLKSLSEVDDRRAYFSEAVQVLMKPSFPDRDFATLGTLADFVKVAPEHEAMIETTLRDELQYVVVPSFGDALRAIEYLKTEGAGRATFLVVEERQEDSASSSIPYSANGDSHANVQPPLRYQTLDSLLGLNQSLAQAFKLALPGLAKATVVDDANQAIQISSLSNGSGPYISLARTGERAIAGRLVTGGSGADKGLGVLGLKREIGELNEKVDSLSDQANTVEDEVNEAKALIAQSEEAQKRHDGDLRQLEKNLVALREQRRQAERDSERTTTHIRVVEQEAAQATEELKEFEAKFEHASEQTGDAEKSHGDAEQVVQAAQAEMAELRRASEIRAQGLSRRRADFATKTERRRGLQNDIRRLETEAHDLESRLSRIRMEVVEAEEQTRTMRHTLTETTEQFQRLSAEKRLRALEFEKRSSALTIARERLNAIDHELRAVREALSLARDQRSQKEIEKARLSSDLEHLVQTCYTELGENIAEICERLDQLLLAPPSSETDEETTSGTSSLPSGQREKSSSSLSDAASTNKRVGGTDEQPEDSEEDDLVPKEEITFWRVPENFDLAAAKVQLDELRKKIDALGPVNMMALEELAEVEDRFEFLVTQKADIESAIAHTQSAIAEIKRRSREKFVEAFYAINENFKAMFLELFGGGHGEMRLIDETDVLESGIEIIAQPPGKRLQNVLLLSGGEKAMAALSLVMAIFKYRPSPFCLLDEVDAPLDDVNIGRFSDKVVEMSVDTQFMIITHSKRTMEAARSLYGVTMEDPGVSKLISVRLS